MKIYRCNTCGKIVVMLNNPGTPTICCNADMECLKPKLVDPTLGEKHVPKVTMCCDKVCVKIGEAPHPQTEDHHIDWIILETEEGYQVRYLKPIDEPKAVFKITKGNKPKAVYCYCNLHGLWKKEIMCHKA